jgi:hypothetical protein
LSFQYMVDAQKLKVKRAPNVFAKFYVDIVLIVCLP